VKCFLFVLPGVLLAGCSTGSIESRKSERHAAYAALPPDMRQLVDQGQIKVGMPMDAVYVAWGQPAEILHNETRQGASTTWLYHGGFMRETRYWAFRQTRSGDDIFLERFLQRDYDPRVYVRAEIVFVEGKVREWRTLPQPTY
jgi:hypothetical protein